MRAIIFKHIIAPRPVAQSASLKGRKSMIILF